MTAPPYTIAFEFVGDDGRLNVRLTANVELHNSDPYYVVQNIMTPGHHGDPILPEVQLRRVKGIWVHTDSGKPSDLSRAIGRAIDAYEEAG